MASHHSDIAVLSCAELDIAVTALCVCGLGRCCGLCGIVSAGTGGGTACERGGRGGGGGRGRGCARESARAGVCGGFRSTEGQCLRQSWVSIIACEGDLSGV